MKFETFPKQGCISKIIRLPAQAHKDVRGILLYDDRPQRGPNPRATVKHAYVRLAEMGFEAYKTNPDYYGLRFVEVNHTTLPTSGHAINIPKAFADQVATLKATWEMVRLEDTYIRLIEIGIDVVEARMKAEIAQAVGEG